MTRTKLLAIITIFAFLLAIMLFALQEGKDEQTKVQAPSKLAPKDSPVSRQKVTVGKTTAKSIENELSISDKKVLDNRQTSYIIGEATTGRPDEIITVNNVAVFERIRIPADPTSLEYTTVAKLIEKFGPPDHVFEGSKYYGDSVAYYLYLSKGYAFVGHIHTGEIYEVQVFKKTTLDGYLEAYGEDLVNTSASQ